MKFARLLVTGMLSLGACTDQISLESGEDAPLAGKGDGTGEIVFGEYLNYEPYENEITHLVLTQANPQDLPHSYFEGRYSLKESRASDESVSSTGFFNVYTYAGQSWIRFLDEETGAYDTAYPKYSWLYLEDTLVMSGVDSDEEYFLEPRFFGTKVGCKLTTLHDDTVFTDFSSEDPNTLVKQNSIDGRIQIRLGSVTWDTASGDTINFTIASDGTATATVTDGAERFVITGPSAASGTGRVTRLQGSTSTLVATLRCTGTTTGQ